MKTLIAAGLAAFALAATTAAAADPVYPLGYHHPIHRALAPRGPIVYRHPFRIAPIHARLVVYREGYFRPGFHETAYEIHGDRVGYGRVVHHAHVWRRVRVRHQIAWRGVHAGERHTV